MESAFPSPEQLLFNTQQINVKLRTARIGALITLFDATSGIPLTAMNGDSMTALHSLPLSLNGYWRILKDTEFFLIYAQS